MEASTGRWSFRATGLPSWEELAYQTWQRIGFLLQAGYRAAKVEGIESNGVAVRSPDDGTPIDVDYTGVVLRLGMKFFLR